MFSVASQETGVRVWSGGGVNACCTPSTEGAPLVWGSAGIPPVASSEGRAIDKVFIFKKLSL